MVQIFTGLGLGYTGLAKSAGYGTNAAAGLGQGGGSLLVNAANGNLVLKQNDGFLAGSLGLSLFHSYNAQGEAGSNWQFSVHSRLIVPTHPNSADSILIRVNEAGHSTSYSYNEARCCYESCEGDTTSIQFSNGSWCFEAGNNQPVMRYSAQGLLQSINSVDGQSLNFSYDAQNQLRAISSSDKNQRIEWQFEQGKLCALSMYSQDERVHHETFRYDSLGRLIALTRDISAAQSYTLRYAYEGESSRISDISEDDGSHTHITYDSAGRVASLTDAVGRTTRFAYFAHYTEITDNAGACFRYSYDHDAQLTAIDGPGVHYRYTYNAQHQLTSSMNGSEEWHYTYNDAGDCIKTEAPNGQITLATYNAHHQLLAQTTYQRFDGAHQNQQPLTERYVYDEHQHLRFKIAADNSVTEYRYDAQGLCTSERRYGNASFNSGHALISEAEAVYWTTQLVHAETSLTQYRYDWRGQLCAIDSYAQVDAHGRGIASSVQTTYYTYDARGQLIGQSRDGVHFKHYLYDDLGRLCQSTDSLGRITSYRYDAGAHQVITTEPNGLQTINCYDVSGLLRSSVQLCGAQNYGCTTYQYDAVGRLYCTTSPQGVSSYVFYDAAGRLCGQINAQGQVRAFHYDAAGRLELTLDYASALSPAQIAAAQGNFNQLKLTSSAQDRRSYRLYNRYNECAYEIDAAGAVVGFRYDAQGNLIAKTAYAERLSPETIAQLSGDSQVLPSLADRHNYYYYDANNRLVGSIDGEGALTSHRYNSQGLLVETRRLAQRFIGNPEHESWGLLCAQLQSTNDRSNCHIYDAAGQLLADIDALGYITTYRYDAQGQLCEKISHAKALDANVLNGLIPEHLDNLALFNLTPSPQNHVNRYRYNAAGLLIWSSDGHKVSDYHYNEAGQLIAQDDEDLATHAQRHSYYRYDARGLLSATLDSVGIAKLSAHPEYNTHQIEQLWQHHAIHYTYDNDQHLLTKTRSDGATTHHLYNDAGQLIYELSAEGGVKAYQYSVFGELSHTRQYANKLDNSQSQLSLSALNKALIALQDNAHDAQTSYEYSSLGQLSARISGNHLQQRLEYNAFNELSRQRDWPESTFELTQSFSYDHNGQLLAKQRLGAGVASQTAQSYDAFGNVASSTDARGFTTYYESNARGERIRLLNEHQQQTFIFDAWGRLIRQCDAMGANGVDYGYNDATQTQTISHNNGITTTTQMNAFGDTISITDGNGHTRQWRYNADGQVIETISASGLHEFFSYDEQQQLLCSVQVNGLVTHFSYDRAGRMLTKTEGEGANLRTNSYTYDGQGLLIKQTNAAGIATTFTYDSEGRVISTSIDPDGLNYRTEFSYDAAGHLIRQTAHNTPGRPSQTQAYEWDAAGRRTATIIDPDGLNLRSSVVYDANDNIIASTDANGNTTHMVYDDLNQLSYRIKPNGVTSAYRYNSKGLVIESTTYAQTLALPLTANNDLEALLTTLSPSPADQCMRYDYDAHGNLRYQMDARGFVTSYSYDNNNNLIQTARYPEAIAIARNDAAPLSERLAHLELSHARVNYNLYDADNHLRYHINDDLSMQEYRYNDYGQVESHIRYQARYQTKAQDQAPDMAGLAELCRPDANRDAITRYCYNSLSELAYQQSPSGSVSHFVYDSLGHLTAKTAYANLVAVDLAEAHWSTRISPSADDRHTQALFDAAGREIYRLGADGAVVGRTFDALGNVIAELAYATRIPLQNNLTQSELENLLKTDNAHDHHSSFSYDAAQRLHTQDLDGRMQSYRYDNNNNLLAETKANGALWQYEYDACNQRTRMSSPPITSSRWVNNQLISETRSLIAHYHYDSFGNLAQSIDDVGGMNKTINYHYDANNQRIAADYPNSTIADPNTPWGNPRQELNQTLTEQWTYNAFGECITSTDKAGISRHMIYDKGQLYAQIDGNGNLTTFSYDGFGKLACKTQYESPVVFDHCPSSTELAGLLPEDTHARHSNYLYDNEGRLSLSFQDALRTYSKGSYSWSAPTTRYSYNAFGEVIRLEQRLDNSHWAITQTQYDLAGKVSASCDAEGYLTTHSYDVFGNEIAQTQYYNRLRDKQNAPFALPQAHPQDRQVRMSYTAHNELATKTLLNVTYQRLNTSTHHYETLSGNLTSSYRYNTLGLLVATVDAQGNEARCDYNAQGQLITKIGSETASGRAATSYSYDGLGQLVETRAHGERAIINADGSYQISNSATDHVQRQQYDAQGLLITSIDAGLQRIDYSYDKAGNIARSFTTRHDVWGKAYVKDLRFSYDNEHHALSTQTQNSDGHIVDEQARYNSFGELTDKGINNQWQMHAEFDKAGRVWRSNACGHYELYAYNLTGQLTQVVTASNAFTTNFGQQGISLADARFEHNLSFAEGSLYYELQRQDNVYDALGHLISQSKDITVQAKDANSQNSRTALTQSQTVDRYGNVLSHTNAQGLTTTYSYNAFNELTCQQLPEVMVTDVHGQKSTIAPTQYYAFDALGRAIAMTDANGHTVMKVLDSLGQVTAEIDALGQVKSKSYDLFGNISSSTDGLGHITTYAYDKENRLLAVTAPNHRIQSYRYDEAGLLLAQANGMNEAQYFEYDTLGRQIRRISETGAQSHYQYDDFNHKIAETDANGRHQSWVYAEGKLIAHTDMSGIESSYRYNSNNLLLEETSSRGKHLSYIYTSDGLIAELQDLKRLETQRYSYDAERRVTDKYSSKAGISNAWVAEHDHFEYDAHGRLLQVVRRDAETIDNNNPNANHELLRVNYDYDAVGNIRHINTQAQLNKRTGAMSGADDWFSYDENNRMRINQGQLDANNNIVIGNNRGSILKYDAQGNLIGADKYDNNQLHSYTYGYDDNNQLNTVYRDKSEHLQSRLYDRAGRVVTQYSYDRYNNLAETAAFTYEHGQLNNQRLYNFKNELVSQTTYYYEAVGNLWMSDYVQAQTGARQVHEYKYAAFDSYQQEYDKVTTSSPGTYGSVVNSQRFYDENALLDHVDEGNTANSIRYVNSQVDGIRSKTDQQGTTSYLNINGKTIGDARLNTDGTQQLNIYGGFACAGTPAPTQISQLFGKANFSTHLMDFLNQANRGATEAITVPTDNLGAYTIQAGDTLENIALMVYGDRTLWYLIADANGINKRDANTSPSGGLTPGQRLTIPQAASSQHQTNETHKVLGQDFYIGDTSPTVPALQGLPVPQPKRKHASILGKILVGAIMIAATIATAAIIGMTAGAGAPGSISGLMALGSSMLSGATTAGVAFSTTTMVAANLAAGFVGSIAGQVASNLMGMQQGINFQGALLSAVATAATAGIIRGVNGTESVTKVINAVDKYSKEFFNVTNAAVMMEQNTISQGANIAMSNQKRFDWLQVGISAAMAGFNGSVKGQALNNKIADLDKTNVMKTELQALTHGAISAELGGQPFNATDTLVDNLGGAIVSGHVEAVIKNESNENSLQTLLEDNINDNRDLNKNKHIKNVSSKIIDKSLEYWGEYGDKVIKYGPKLLGIWGGGPKEKIPEYLFSAHLPQFPDWVANTVGGFGDVTSFGLTEILRSKFTRLGTVDKGSTAYRVAGAVSFGAYLVTGQAHSKLITQAYQFGKQYKWITAGKVTAGATSGGIGSATIGGDKKDIIYGAGVGAFIGYIGTSNAIGNYAAHPVTLSAVGNISGQYMTNIRSNNANYSLISLGFSLMGNSVGRELTKNTLGLTKFLRSTMYETTFNSIGWDLGKRSKY